MASEGSLVLGHDQYGGSVEIQVWVHQLPSHRVQAKCRSGRIRFLRGKLTQGVLNQLAYRDAALHGPPLGIVSMSMDLHQ